MALPFDALTHPLVIAHRGSMMLGPENTLYTFELAASAGADVLELDVHPSRDGAVMVIHDPTLDRTSNGTGPVSAMRRSALQKLDFAWHFALEGEDRPLRGRGITIPTLEEVFDTFPESHFSIDVKADDARFATDVIALIMERGMRDRVVVGSFHRSVAAILRSAFPPLYVAADRGQGVRLLLSSTLRLPLLGNLPSAFMLPDHLGALPVATRRLVDRVHRAGRRCYFWTVDCDELMRRILEAGADGIVTNRPDLLFAVRRDYLAARRARGAEQA